MNPLGGTATDLTFTDRIQTLPLTFSVDLLPAHLQTYTL